MNDRTSVIAIIYFPAGLNSDTLSIRVRRFQNLSEPPSKSQQIFLSLLDFPLESPLLCPFQGPSTYSFYIGTCLDAVLWGFLLELC